MALPASRKKTKVGRKRPDHVRGFDYHIEKRVVNGRPGPSGSARLDGANVQYRLANPDSIYGEKAA
jgi:hypothetical protein